jgi:hypothetical protein
MTHVIEEGFRHRKSRMNAAQLYRLGGNCGGDLVQAAQI